MHKHKGSETVERFSPPAAADSLFDNHIFSVAVLLSSLAIHQPIDDRL